MSPEIIAAVVGVVLFGVLQFLKKTGAPAKPTIIALCVAVGLLYTGYLKYIPADLQQRIFAFVSQAFTVSWGLYEILWKGYQQLTGNVPVKQG